MVRLPTQTETEADEVVQVQRAIGRIRLLQAERPVDDGGPYGRQVGQDARSVAELAFALTSPLDANQLRSAILVSSTASNGGAGLAAGLGTTFK